jgi:uncharacterized membrane protein
VLPAIKLFLHRSFQVGISIKGFDGLVEVIGGIVVWFITPANGAVAAISRYEQSGPHNFLVEHFFHTVHILANGDKFFVSSFLLSHGIVKIILVVALWFNRLWAYPLMILVFGGFAIYQVYRLTYSHSSVLLAITIFDFIVVWLTWREYREQLKLRARA